IQHNISKKQNKKQKILEEHEEHGDAEIRKTQKIGERKNKVDILTHITDLTGGGIDYSSAFNTTTFFVSDEAAIDDAKSTAILNGFTLTISKHTKGERLKILKCKRGERYRGKKKVDVASRKSKTNKCQCPFEIRVKRVPETQFWMIHKCLNKEKGFHNHSFAVYPEGHRESSGISQSSKKIIRDMTAAHVTPANILAAVQEKNPGDHAIVRQIYNYRDMLRKESFEGRDVTTQLLHLARSSSYIVYTDFHPDTSALTHIFMAHPDSVRLFRTYHLYVGIDSTYKTNRYKMPLVEMIGMTPCNNNFLIAYALVKDEKEASYEWVLHKLRLLIGSE
ncbi:Unknown protein, partial [Striga hermonthica]